MATKSQPASSAGKKSATASAGTAKKKAAAGKNKAKQTSKPPRKTATKTPPVITSRKALLLKSFAPMASPAPPYCPPSPEAAPLRARDPFISAASPEERDRIRRLLFKRFDRLAQPAPAAPGGAPRSVPPPPHATATGTPRQRDPARRILTFGALALAAILALLVVSSTMNKSRYYLKSGSSGVEVWKGTFSPTGTRKIMALGDISAPTDGQGPVSRDVAYALMFDAFIRQADDLLNEQAVPDFKLIRQRLVQALPYAVNAPAAETAHRRIAKIDMMMHVYKADILAGKGTPEALSEAREILAGALDLDIDSAERSLVAQKLKWLGEKQERGGTETDE